MFAEPNQADLVAVTDDVYQRLKAGAAVAVGVSGGKDSQACAIAVDKYLKEIGHTGPRVLVHADLGMVEWEDSLPTCQRLATHLGWELVVVRRAAGGMMERWEGRWKNNVARYIDLSCVNLILPWSSPKLRFCTSELKTAVITAKLKAMFPNHDIINATGIRREESKARSQKPISKLNENFVRKGRRTNTTGEAPKTLTGYDWNPIIDYPVERVFSSIAAEGLELHEGYTKYGMTRISCAFCIMGSIGDLLSSTKCEANQAVYRRMVELEAESTYAFQGSRWLADVAPHLLSTELLARVARAKELAKQRIAIESEIPEHLKYDGKWPKAMPTLAEAELIASVRRRITTLMGFEGVQCLRAEDVMERYRALVAHRESKMSKPDIRRPASKAIDPAENQIIVTTAKKIEGIGGLEGEGAPETNQILAGMAQSEQPEAIV